MFNLSDQIAVVTGSASGIGAACARQLAAAGATVVFADIRFEPESGSSAALPLTAHLDVSDRSSVERLAHTIGERFGRLDILVNAAGIFPRGTLAETTEVLWDHIMAVNLKGMFHCCQTLVPWLSQSPHGPSIVNIGSVNAQGGAQDLLAYSVSKGGVSTLTKNLARALAPARIRVNCVHPGWVLTEGETAVQRATGQPEDWHVRAGAKIPLGRILVPDDIASTVLFLSSPLASQITGQEWTIDGGASLSCN